MSLDEDLLGDEDDLTGDIPTDLEEDLLGGTPDALLETDELEVETSQQEADDEEYEDEPLDGPLGKVVQALPFLKPLVDKLAKRNQDEEDDFDEATKTEINNSEITAKKKTDIKKILSQQLPFLSKFLNKKINDEEEDEEFDPDAVAPIRYGDEEEEVEKPKKKITPIHIVVILGIILLGYDTLMEEPEPVSKPVLKKIVREKKKPVVKKPVEEKKEVVDSELRPKKIESEETKPQIAKPVVEKPVAIEPKEESLDDLFADDDPINKIEVKPQPSENNTVVKEDSSDLDALADDEDENEQLATGQTDVSMGEDPFGDMPISDGVIDSSLIGDSTSTDITESILKDLEVRVESTKKLKKIEKALKPVDAPEYDMQGRALVYNCSGKHWACIDSVNYKICGQNYSWNSEKGKTIECYPVDNYDSAEDCTIVQQSKIDNVADTGFCQ